MAEPVQRRGDWWQEQPDGSWLKWNEQESVWEPQSAPPPPPEVASPPPEVGPVSKPTVSGGYRYVRRGEEWWARRLSDDAVYKYDPRSATWNPSSAGAKLHYAGFWRRAGAAIIDTLITGAGGFLLGYIIGYSALDQYPTAEEVEQVSNTASLFGIIAGWLYFALMESSRRQATLGKMALGIQVTDMDGKRVSFGKATGRYFGKFISGLILFVGFLMAGWTEKKQALHDIMARCLVVVRSRI